MQVEADLARLGKRPALLARKWRRMAQSSFAFLRGASSMWAEALRRHPWLLRGLPGSGWLVGDLHLENVGVFHTRRGVTFHVNDFDETFHGPVGFDVLRLLTSTLLARSELETSGLTVLTIGHDLLEGYDVGLQGRVVRPPPFLRALETEVATASPEALLKKKVDEQGKLVRNQERTPPAPRAVVSRLPRALEQWRTSLPAPIRPSEAALEVVDVTRRIAGTGSLGVERLWVLVRGADGGPWLLEVKEVRGSAWVDQAPSAQQLVEVVQQVLPRPPLYLAPAQLGRVPVVVTRLQAKEDKLSVEDIPADGLAAFARHLGSLVGEVHRRGGAKARWPAKVQARALDAAQYLSGIHQTAFLQFCDEVYDRGVRD